jgi:hypothetical protein
MGLRGENQTAPAGNMAMPIKLESTSALLSIRRPPTMPSGGRVRRWMRSLFRGSSMRLQRRVATVTSGKTVTVLYLSGGAG